VTVDDISRFEHLSEAASTETAEQLVTISQEAHRLRPHRSIRPGRTRRDVNDAEPADVGVACMDDGPNAFKKLLFRISVEVLATDRGRQAKLGNPGLGEAAVRLKAEFHTAVSKTDTDSLKSVESTLIKKFDQRESRFLDGLR
jgi:hypothetical protein